MVFLHSTFRLFFAGLYFFSQCAFGALFNMLTYLECYILGMKSLLAWKLMGVLPQTAYILMPSTAFEAGTSLFCSSVCVMVPMDE